MTPRHVIVLLDIDNTLIKYNASCPKYNPYLNKCERTVTWNGGSHEVWANHLETLQKTALEHNLCLHFGIATYKPEYVDDAKKTQGLRGDYLSAAILEDEKYITHLEYCDVQGLETNHGLKKYIDPNLVYFTGSQSKTTYAIEPAIKHITDKYCTFSNFIDAFLMDDLQSTCDEVEKNGHHGICVSNLAELTLYEQKERISQAFQQIYSKLKLPLPDNLKTKDNLSALENTFHNHMKNSLFHRSESVQNLQDQEGMEGVLYGVYIT